ncbi:MAG: flagellar hook-basal body protein [Firmicutes bacterium]|nr:flagellar hook-basal body protein [Bacillota bacterium]
MDALYIGASGMLAQNQSLALIADNLANSQSPGYLATVGTFVAFPSGTVLRTGPLPGVIGQSSAGVALTSEINTRASDIEPTANPLDFAINGPGFFVVNTPKGLAYTRDGQFSLDANGRLVTSRGDYVLDQAGKPIALNPALPVSVNSAGVITQGGKVVATLALTNLSPVNLKAIGNNLYQGGARLPFTGQVEQSALNTSNVNLSEAMVQLIDAESRYQSLTDVVNEESKRLSTAATLGMLT